MYFKQCLIFRNSFVFLVNFQYISPKWCVNTVSSVQFFKTGTRVIFEGEYIGANGYIFVIYFCSVKLNLTRKLYK